MAAGTGTAFGACAGSVFAACAVTGDAKTKVPARAAGNSNRAALRTLTPDQFVCRGDIFILFPCTGTPEARRSPLGEGPASTGDSHLGGRLASASHTRRALLINNRALCNKEMSGRTAR